jgi:hypothetical protein
VSKVVVAAILLPIMASCVSWQDGMRKGLRTSGEVALQASETIDTVCKQVLSVCKAQKKNPCPALTQCLIFRHQILTHLGQAIYGTALGYMAVEAGEQEKARECLAKIKELLEAARTLLEAVK